MVIMNDLERPMISYYMIYYEKFRKVMQRRKLWMPTDNQAGCKRNHFDHLYVQDGLGILVMYNDQWRKNHNGFVSDIVIYRLHLYELAGKWITTCFGGIRSLCQEEHDIWSQETYSLDTNSLVINTR